MSLFKARCALPPRTGPPALRTPRRWSANVRLTAPRAFFRIYDCFFSSHSLCLCAPRSEWWHTRCGSGEEFDRGSLCVGNVDNDPGGALKIVTGSFSGVLRIYAPRSREFKVEDLLLEIGLGAPILQLECGRFTSCAPCFSLPRISTPRPPAQR